ncbi:MAG: hypothetical protein HC843_01780 [Sphingomonadales bacterium]|nr:hypothetical protein [Sphingomonadales bacterium]
MRLALQNGDIRLDLLPARGGGVGQLRWRGHDIFRAADSGHDPLQLANFPLIPFCNRIGHCQFDDRGRTITLPVTHEQAESEHSLHGLGWINPWTVESSDASSAALSHSHDGSIWPWAYQARQI